MMTKFEVVAAPTSTVPAAPTFNILTRGRVLGGDNNLIAGFIVTGTETKRVVLRAIAPSLTAAGVPGALNDPGLQVFNSSNTQIAQNDNWQSDSGAAEIQNTWLAPAIATESATVQSLAPGSYTLVVSGKNNATGIAVVEAYDITPTANSTLANISTRGLIGLNDDVLIGGFIIGGNGSARVG